MPDRILKNGTKVIDLAPKFKVGDIVLDENEEIGIIIAPYEHDLTFDWEVECVEGEFSYGHTKRDCFRSSDLSKYVWGTRDKEFEKKLAMLSAARKI